MSVEIVKPGTQFDFLGKWRICVTVSALLVLIGIAGIPLRGFRLGIDFAGGTEVQVRFLDVKGIDEGNIRNVVEDLGIPNASVTRFGGGDSQEFLIKFRGRRGSEETAQDEGEEAKAASAAGDDAEGGSPAEGDAAKGRETDRVRLLEDTLDKVIGPLEVERVDFVGPKVGAELRENGLRAIAIACLLILIYIGFRFSIRYAPGAVIALIHDVAITASIWIVMGLEFDLRVLAALLAIIGYSLNDTIIVYDRIRENMELHTKYDLKEVLNRSVNQTLSRTLLTSLTTLAAVLALLLLGGDVIRPFALAMAIGILVGTYSSIYIASPSLLWLETRFGASGGSRSGGGGEPTRGEKPKAPKRSGSKKASAGSKKPGSGSKKAGSGSKKAGAGSKKAKAGSRRRPRPS